MMRKNRKLFISLIALVFLLGPQLVCAIGTGGISIKPAFPNSDIPKSDSWFIYNLDAGQAQEDGVLLINDRDQAVRVEVYAVDAQTTSQGGFAPNPKEVVPEGVGAWVKLSERFFDIEAHSTKIIPFTITIPEKVDVGDHMGAILIQEAPPESASGEGTRVEIVTRIGARIYEKVPGEEIRKLKINAIDWTYNDNHLFEGEVRNNWLQLKRFLGFGKPVTVQIQQENEGNQTLNPTGQLTLTNLFGQINYKMDVSLGEIFPKEQNAPPFDWTKPFPPIGRYKLKAVVTYNEALPPVEKEIVFWILPYNLIIILVVLAVISVLIRLTWQLIIIKKRKKWATHVVQPGETVMDIATLYAVKWKKIIKVNKLKKPFTLSSGEILWIPGQKKKKETEKVGTELPQEARQGKTYRLMNWNLTPVQFWSGVSGFTIVVLAVVWFTWLSDIFLKPAVNTNTNANINTNSNINTNLIPQEALDRDTQRKADLETIQDALERYKLAEGKYPVASERDRTNKDGNVLQIELLNKGHLLTLPVDPLDPQYYYGYLSADGTTYELTAVLENTADPDGILVNNFYLYQLIPATQ